MRGGIYWGVPSGDRGPLLVNNTIADNRGQGSGIFAGGFDAQAQLFNNIVVAAPGQSAVYCDPFYDPSPPIFMSNNVFSSGAAAYGGTCGDPTGTNGNISADPLFVDPAGTDYHLGPVRLRSTWATTPLRNFQPWTSTGIRGSSVASSIKEGRVRGHRVASERSHGSHSHSAAQDGHGELVPADIRRWQPDPFIHGDGVGRTERDGRRLHHLGHVR
jgi:hypothetical protein